MKILHISHHDGCIADLNQVFTTLGHEIHVQKANWNYNMGIGLAADLYHQHKEYYNSFDVIITSDTAPLCRIFLQQHFPGKLIIWVCNRFDYADMETNKVGFPDPAYYQMFKDATTKPNVKIFSYTKFEHEYAKKHRGFSWYPQNIIRPCCHVAMEEGDVTPPPHLAGKFLITRYHNDNKFMDLQKKCDELGIPTWRGEYNGIKELRGIEGIIHIPYAWSNLALFENWSIGNVYFIPTKEFLLELSRQPNFFWSPPFDRDFIESSEWYLPEHADLFMYFSSWDHLKQLTQNHSLLFEKQHKVKEFSQQHVVKTLEQWKNAVENW